MARFTILALVAAVSAHFEMLTPPSIGFSDSDLGKAPCGGFTPNFATNQFTDFHVGGDAIGMSNGHPETNWLFRATLDEQASGNWTQIFHIVRQGGLGDFCEPSIAITDPSFVGKKGIIGVVAHSPDGFLYQCCAVNFVAGVGQPNSQCKNATITVDFTDDSGLSALISGAASSTTPSVSTSPTSKPNAAASLRGSLTGAGAVAAIVSLSMALGGALFVL